VGSRVCGFAVGVRTQAPFQIASGAHADAGVLGQRLL
jgi:hypothetical protein